MSVFELNVRGYSDWTDAFTMDEWKWFGYTQDLLFYHCAGCVLRYQLLCLVESVSLTYCPQPR